MPPTRNPIAPPRSTASSPVRISATNHPRTPGAIPERVSPRGCYGKTCRSVLTETPRAPRVAPTPVVARNLAGLLGAQGPLPHSIGYRWLHGGVGNRGFPAASSSGQTTTFTPSCHWMKSPLLAIWNPRSSTAKSMRGGRSSLGHRGADPDRLLGPARPRRPNDESDRKPDQ